MKPVEQVLKDIPGKDRAALRRLAVALARDAVFGREAWAKTYLSDADPAKMDYVKSMVHSREI